MKHNVNRPGGAASETAALPDWLAVYPGARKSPKGKISWSFQPTAEFVSGDPIRRVYEYYRSAVRGAGATITSEGLMQSGKPPKDFGAHIKALRGDDGIEIRIGEVIRFSSGLPGPPAPKQTGIGIRYTVPKR